jgi:hypothetical protein
MNSSGPVFDLLFCRIPSVHAVRDKQLADTVAAVDRLTHEALLTGDQDKIVGEIVDAGSVNVPVLDRENISYRRTEREGVVTDLFGDRVLRKQSVYLFDIPFVGDGPIFDVRPPQFDLSAPRGEAKRAILTVAVLGQEDPQALKREVDETLNHIEQYLESHRQFWTGFDQQLEAAVRQRFHQRREALKAQNSTAQGLEGLGFKKK